MFIFFIFFVFKKMKRKNTPRPSEHPPVMEEKIFRDNKSKYWNYISTCTEDVQNI